MTQLQPLQARGNAYDLGHQIGLAVHDRVHAVSIHNAELKSLQATWHGSGYLRQLEAAARQFYPQFVREMEGMADGIGLPFQQIFIWNCRGDLRLPGDLPVGLKNAAADGCTTLLIPGAMTPEDPHIIAHNEDGSDDLYGHCFWLSATPDSGPSFESYLYPGMIAGHTLAVNGAGLVQTINNLRVHDLQPGIPRHLSARAVLGCSSIDDAIEILNRTDRASGFHHNLGQAGDRRLISVEAPASGCAVRHITTPSAHANHLLDPQFAHTEQSITASSAARQTRASHLLAAATHRDGGPEAVLFDRAETDKTIHRRPGDGSDDYGRTLATGVFKITADGVSWAIHDGPQQLNLINQPG